MSAYDDRLAAVRKAHPVKAEPAPVAADLAARSEDGYRMDRSQEAALKRERKIRTR